jgi:uncharacterized Fe-S cluster protein YjdI
MWSDHVVTPNPELVRIRGVLAMCSFPHYTLDVVVNNGSYFIFGQYAEGETRKWVLPPEPDANKIVKTAFRCISSSMEYRARRNFTFKRAAIFGPELDVDKLVEIANA